jgi:CheY-like chemotaxis protein/predicted transcriptional regulator
LLNKNTLGSFSFDVIERILDVLKENGTSMKKTNLATRAGLNYNVCLRYIRMLSNLGWIEVNSEVNITDAGNVAFAKFLDESRERASNVGVHDENDGSSNIKEKGVEHSSSYDISSPSSTTAHTMSQLAVLNEIQPSLERNHRTHNRNKKTIMVVDDEVDIAQTYEHFLTSVGYEVRTFIDSRSALHEYVSNPFLYDMLVLDIRMQGINGLQLYQSIKAINPECRAIFVSALDSVTEVVSILPGTKPQDIMRKPVSREQFVKAVKIALAEQ